MCSKCVAAALIILSFPFSAFSQDQQADSVRVLEEVLVQAYATDRPSFEVPAAVSFISTKALDRFNNTSVLPAVNMVPGVRMEERSPGSYRFSIRGSLLRSPFGVRNVKMYWNGLPLTDGGGNTYINLIDNSSISSMEIIKGPGASLYGAGTGGVVLFKSKKNVPKYELSAMGGSYGLLRLNSTSQILPNLIASYALQRSDGYRDHTKMNRSTFRIEYHPKLNKKNELHVNYFYSNLFYQTPGGLTRAQYDTIPRGARLRADELNASIENKTHYLGISDNHQWSDHWSTQFGVYASKSAFVNPTFRILNYEEREETNVGGRLENQYKFQGEKLSAKITFGAEFQYFKSPLRNYENVGGSPGLLTFDDELFSNQSILFLQSEFDFPSNIILTLGGSTSFIKYEQRRKHPEDTVQVRKFDPVFAPRIALLKKMGGRHSVYASLSYGFSTPTLADVRPSTNEFNNKLDPEHGVNYEMGFKGRTTSDVLRYEVVFFEFDLKETIVNQPIEEDGPDYFVNAGRTRQRGIEIGLSWSPIVDSKQFFSDLSFNGGYTINRFTFEDYANDSTFNGNSLTGVPANVIALGVDTQIRSRLYSNLTASYTDRIPLNDANTEYASEYLLLGCRVGYLLPIKEIFMIDIFAGGDNLLDQKYSLGNDLNAPGDRFFNTAPGANFYVGVKFSGL
jgi:iron complex outermembrane receptor protein